MAKADPRQRSPSGLARWFTPLWFVMLLVGALEGLVAALSLTWPLAQDGAKMRFSAWLLLGGMAPYREVQEVNQPGTLLYNLVLVAISRSDVWFHVVDLGVLALTAAGVAALGRRLGDARFSAALALVGCHLLAIGPPGTLERDLIIALLAVWATRAVLAWLEEPRVWLLVAAGLLVGAATTIKADAAMFLLPLAAVVARKDRRCLVALLGAALAPWIPLLAWVLAEGALADLWWAMAVVVPHYNGADYPARLPWIPFPVRLGATVALAGLASVVVYRDPSHRKVLGAIACMGLLHAFVQGKGFLYHFLPAVALVPVAALSMIPHPSRGFAAAALALVVPVWFVGYQPPVEGGYDPGRRQDSLSDLLAAVGPGQSVQAFEFMEDLDDALFRRDLRPATGLVYDLFLFEERPSTVRERSRERLMSELDRSPPTWILVSNYQVPGRGEADRLDAWPAFVAWLDERYVLDRDAGAWRAFRRRGAASNAP